MPKKTTTAAKSKKTTKAAKTTKKTKPSSKPKAAAAKKKASGVKKPPAKKTAPKKEKKVAAKPTAEKKAKETKKTKPAKAKRGKRGRACYEDDCSLPIMTEGYCRLHYIKNWQEIVDSRRTKARTNLNKYVDALAEKYPADYMDRIKVDLGDEKSFHSRLQELGFRKELEGSGDDNPFQAGNLAEFMSALKFDE